MFKRSSDGSIKGIIISMIALLALGGFAFAADTWNREDEEHFQSEDLHTGAKLAVAEVLFLPEGGQEVLTLLIAITDGEDKVRIYSFDTGSSSLTFEDEVTVVVSNHVTPVAWTPTFMDLDIDQGGDESCLVIPTLHEGDYGGSISIVRLTERDGYDKLEVIHDCSSFDLGTNWSVYHVAELHPTAEYDYAISTECGIYPPPGHDYDIIALASFDGSSNKFVDEDTLHIPGLYYGARHAAIRARSCVTKFQDFQFGSVIDKTLCYSTTHNGGILIWDPTLEDPEIISRIAASQHGGWQYEPGIGGELGDVHRAVVLEGASGTIANLDNALVSSRLLFFSNNTMGFIINDISKPDAPQYVWQWDCDTRPCEDDAIGGDWGWHGAGDVDDDVISKANAESFPGETFGIGVASYLPEEQPPIIHVYLAGGVDGLRLFDLSEFLDPFGEDRTGESNYDDFEIDIYVYQIGLDYMQAYDLQTFSEGGDTYVFTSWKEDRSGVGDIGLTVHLDEDVECD